MMCWQMDSYIKLWPGPSIGLNKILSPLDKERSAMQRVYHIGWSKKSVYLCVLCAYVLTCSPLWNVEMSSIEVLISHVLSVPTGQTSTFSGKYLAIE